MELILLPFDFEFDSTRLNCQEEDGSDSCVKTLRSCLQAVEQSGMVDFEIGGHEFERPAEVFAGEADDKLLDASKEKCHSDTFVVLFHTADQPVLCP